MIELGGSAPAARIWAVGALCQAIAQALDARFNPVRVAGEISGFSRATSGHCYFVLKDGSGQLRCAMFRRVAEQLGPMPRDGDRVVVRGRLGVYEARGELQLIVESLQREGQGNLYEQFLERKDRLEQEGLFAASRKRAVTPMPRGIGIVTSLGAAALHDVVTTLQRRAPHIPVVVVPASVQGEQAAPELARALRQLYRCVAAQNLPFPIDTILLVRGGGSMEDLWAFNDEALARTIADSPVPVITGVGHETDFTIADFVADLRAPTPTGAAEMASVSTEAASRLVDEMDDRLQSALLRQLDRQAQHLDRLAARMGRLSVAVDRNRARLLGAWQGLQHGVSLQLQRRRHQLTRQHELLPATVERAVTGQSHALSAFTVRLQALDPSLVLQRGYVWLSDADGVAITHVGQMAQGQAVRATLADGHADLVTLSTHHN